MIALCGIEIRVGQVWKSASGFICTVKEVGERITLCLPNFDENPLRNFSNQPEWVNAYRCPSPKRFTNKPRGYRLVRDVEKINE